MRGILALSPLGSDSLAVGSGEGQLCGVWPCASRNGVWVSAGGSKRATGFK